MQAIISRQALLDAASVADDVALVRTPKPVLSCVHLKCEKDAMTVRATDLARNVRIGLNQVQVEREGEALVNSGKFLAALRSTNAETVSVKADGDGTLRMSANGTTWKLFGPEPKDMPPDPKIISEGMKSVAVPAALLQRMLARTSFAANKAASDRYAMAGLLVAAKGRTLEVCGCDGRRMSLATSDIPTAATGDLNVVIPMDTVNSLKSMEFDKEDIATISADDRMIRIECGDTTLTTVQLEGSFPPVHEVIPKEYTTLVTVGREETITALSQVSLMTTEDAKGAKFEFADVELRLTASSPDHGTSESRLDVKVDGPPVTIGLNPYMVIEGLRAAGSDLVKIEMTQANRAIAMRSDGFCYVQMPVNLD